MLVENFFFLYLFTRLKTTVEDGTVNSAVEGFHKFLTTIIQGIMMIKT